MNARLITDGELAERHAWKVFQLRPVHVMRQSVHHVQPVQAVLRSDEGSYEDNLRHGVGGVDQLDDDVASDEVVFIVVLLILRRPGQLSMAIPPEVMR